MPMAANWSWHRRFCETKNAGVVRGVEYGLGFAGAAVTASAAGRERRPPPGGRTGTAERCAADSAHCGAETRIAEGISDALAVPGNRQLTSGTLEVQWRGFGQMAPPASLLDKSAFHELPCHRE